jgi:hypothetical protein
MSVSNPKQQDLDSTDHAAPRLSEWSDATAPIAVERANDLQDRSGQPKPDERIGQLQLARIQIVQIRKPPDTFAEAVAKVTQGPLEQEPVEAPYILQNRQPLGLAVGFAVAAGVAALVALVFVVGFPASQGPAEADAMSAFPTWQSLRTSLFTAPQRKPAPTLMVRDGSGPANEPLSLGVSVSSPGPGATVIIGGMPAGARLTLGQAINTSEWQVKAQEISEASIIPPPAFVGAMNLTAELRGGDGDALVGSSVWLTWTPTSSVGAVGIAANAATMPSDSAVQAPQLPQPKASPAPAAVTRATPPLREIHPEEVAGFVRRATELLAAGDLQAARLLLLRAADAHDAGAALALARTFDPMVSRQFGVADPDVDLAQARNWYQKAEEWGSPEARRQLDALASRTR